GVVAGRKDLHLGGAGQRGKRRLAVFQDSDARLNPRLDLGRRGGGGRRRSAGRRSGRGGRGGGGFREFRVPDRVEIPEAVLLGETPVGLGLDADRLLHAEDEGVRRGRPLGQGCERVRQDERRDVEVRRLRIDPEGRRGGR